MFMRLIVYAEKEEEAYAVYNDCVKDIEDSILEVQTMKLKPYWKIAGMYEIETALKLNIIKEKFILFLDSISDYWEELGAPVPNDLLATAAAAGCHYIKSNISLVDLFLEEAEYSLIPDWEEKWKQVWLEWLEETKDIEKQTTEEALGLTKEQIQDLKDRLLEKNDRVNVAMICMNDGYTFDSVVKELDAGKTVEELFLQVYPDF